MHKKLIMACMAIAAFAAFVVAPAASATTLKEGETSLAVGASVTATNTGNTEFTGGFNVVCDHADLSGKVTRNDGTSVEGEVPVGSALFNGTGANTDCTSALGDVKVTVTSKLCFKTGEFTTQNGTKHVDGVSVTGCGGNVTFVLDSTSTGIQCKYTTASVVGQYLTAPSDATIKTEGQSVPEEEGKLFCPDSGVLKMDFDLTTTNGATLTFVSGV